MPWWLSWASDLKWGDWWAAIQGIALSVAAVLVVWQIRSLRRDQCAWKSLDICDRYDFDPVLDAALVETQGRA